MAGTAGHLRGVAALRRIPPADLTARVRLICEQHGVSGAHAMLGVSRESLARIAGGLRVLPGTIALVQAQLEKIDAREAAELAAVDRLVGR